MAGYSAYTDQELVALLKQGNELAFDVIYMRYWKKFYNEAYHTVATFQKAVAQLLKMLR